MRYDVYDGQRKVAENWIPFGGSPQYRVLMIFDWEELKYQLSNLTYTQGDVARVHDKYGHDLLNEDASHYVHQWKDICEDGNVDRVREMVRLALSECEKLLYKYTSTRLGQHLSVDNVECDQTEFVLELRVPGTFAESTCMAIMRSVNEYVKDRVLADWASITYPEAAEGWERKRAEMEQQIRRCATMCGANHKVKPSII